MNYEADDIESDLARLRRRIDKQAARIAAAWLEKHG